MPITDLGPELAADLLDTLFHLRWLNYTEQLEAWNCVHDHHSCFVAVAAPMRVLSGSFDLNLPVGSACLLPPGSAQLRQETPGRNIFFGFTLRHLDRPVSCLAHFNLPQVVVQRDPDRWQAHFSKYGSAHDENRQARLMVRPACEEFLHHHLADGIAQGVYQPARGVVADWLRTARDHLEHDSPSTPLHLGKLAGELGVTLVWFERCFRAAYGCTPSAYRRRVVLREAAQKLVADPELSVAEVAAACGYASQSGFCRAFRTAYGCSPLQFRHGSQPTKDSMPASDIGQLTDDPPVG